MENRNDVVKITKNYYDSNDADEFYFQIWGGEDIHIGIYDDEHSSIFDASKKTVEKMAAMVKNLDATTTVLDIGSGYGGAARYLAKNFSCKVQCLNLSERANERNQHQNEQQNLTHLIDITQGNFEEIPAADNSFDVVWSEDAILHSARKDIVFKEVARVLKKGGQFIFTDPMQSDHCPPGVLKDVLARIHLDSMGSFQLYQTYARQNNLQQLEIIDLSQHLSTHYSRVLQELTTRYDEINRVISKEYLERMSVGLRHWIKAGSDGYLAWGILHFELR